jgi:hypothetical protein
MKLYRFSPIENEGQLLETIKYVHFECSKLCKKAFGKYLPVAGNIGIFCHFEDEYKFLTKLREELTEQSDNWNQKYFHLHKPIIIPTKNDIPETTYTYLYIRRPDNEKPQVGDADFVLEKKKFNELKKSIFEKKEINGVEMLYRPDLDMIRLSKIDSDILPYITTKTVAEAIK